MSVLTQWYQCGTWFVCSILRELAVSNLCQPLFCLSITWSRYRNAYRDLWIMTINLQAAGSPQQAPPTYIAKMWKLIKFRKNVIFSRNHTDVNPDDWTITKKTIRTTIHENFSKMKNLKVDRWALSLSRIRLRKAKYDNPKPCWHIIGEGDSNSVYSGFNI